MSQFVAEWASAVYKNRSTGKNVAKTILVSGALSILTAPLGFGFVRTYRSLKPKELHAKAQAALYPKELKAKHAAMVDLFDAMPLEMKAELLVFALKNPKAYATTIPRMKGLQVGSG